jgi:seryl-tRNA synthetase
MAGTKQLEPGDWKSQIAFQFGKAGPWALLSLLLLGTITFAFWRTGCFLGPIFTQWIAATRALEEQNAENVAALLVSQQSATREHKALMTTAQQLASNQNEITKTFVDTLKEASAERQLLMQSTTVLQDALTERSAEHSNQDTQLQEIVRLIARANELMATVPAKRDEELKLLSDIQQSMRAMVQEIKSLSRATAGEELGPP